MLAESAMRFQYRPEQKALTEALVRQAVAAGLDRMAIQTPAHINDEDARSLWLIALAPHLSPGLVVDLYEATWDEKAAGGTAWYAAQIRAGITPAVVDGLAAEPALGERLMRILREAAGRGHLTGLPADLAAHLPAVLINAGVRATHDFFNAELKAHALARLAPYRPADQRHGLFRRALDVVWQQQQFQGTLKTGSKWDREDDSRPIAADFADPLLGIGPLLTEKMIGEALNKVDSLFVERTRARMLMALAPYLVGEHFERALEKTGRFDTPRHRAGALISLAPHLPPERLETAFEISDGLQPPALRLNALLALLRRATAVAPAQLPSRWGAALHLASRGSRPDFLAHLRELTPALHALGGREALDATRRAIGDVGRWWP